VFLFCDILSAQGAPDNNILMITAEAHMTRLPAAPGDWVEVELNETSVAALLCSVPTASDFPSAEAIYLDEDTHARLAVLKWDTGRWALAHPEASSGYVDHYTRVASYVEQLRKKRE
jgi:hypothetical protein